MDPSCLVSTVQAGGGGVMVWGIFSWHTLGPLVPIEHCLNATAYLSIVADHVLYDFSVPIFWCYFQQDNAPYHKAQIISDWFLVHDNEFTLLKWPPQSPDLNPIEHIWDVVEREIHIIDVQPTNLQQLCDAIMSIWTKISEECFQHLAESMSWRIKVISEGKRGVQPGTSKVYLIVASECIYYITFSRLYKHKACYHSLQYSVIVKVLSVHMTFWKSM